MLRSNKVRETMLKGGKVIGAYFTLGSVAAVEILAQLGLDCIVIDTEHGPFAAETCTQFIIASESRGMVPFVRVKDHSRDSILKMLDIGAMGLVIPYIKTMDEVKDVVRYGKYRPVGDRGFGFGRKTCYGLDPILHSISDYFEWANRETLLIPQCETVEALKCIEEIAALDGVDGIFVGPFDLSVSMGIPKQFDNPDFLAAMRRVLKACRDSGKFCWTLGMTIDDTKARFEMGFDGILTCDTVFFASGTKQYLSGVKGMMRDHK